MESETVQQAFPPPPMQYVELYSDERVAAHQSPAPPPPIEGHYTTFGEQLNTKDGILQSLEDSGIQVLYNPAKDRRDELKRLTRSLVAAFLDLLEILKKSPDSPERAKKIDDLRLLFINTHHLINEYRPHQAKETLNLMMEVQRQERLQTVERFQSRFRAVRQELQDCLHDLPSSVDLPIELTEKIEQTLAKDPKLRSRDGGRKQKSATDMDSLMCDVLDDDS